LITQGADTRQFDQTTKISDSTIMTQLTSIARYPVKGLTADYLREVVLDKDQWLPFDRSWAIENGIGLKLKKKHYMALCSQAELAQLRCKFDAETTAFSLALNGRAPVTCQLDDEASHSPMIELLKDLLGDLVKGELRIAHIPGQAMTDVPEPQSSIINAASVRDLGERIGHELDPARFRGNLVIDGVEPWSELDWVGREFKIGELTLRGESRTDRCTATSINVETAKTDIDVPKALFDNFGHIDCGIYASIVSGGRIAVGDPVRLIS
jgi:uncharacterized protein YcbX